MDPKDPTAVKRKWLIPFRAKPIGVTFDENVLYLAFNDPELKDLSFLVFGEGTFEISTRKDAEEGGVGKVIETGASPAKQIRFDRWKNTYLVNFKSVCSKQQ
jgi:hypothetical protein